MARASSVKEPSRVSCSPVRGTLSLATPEAIVAAWIASPEHLANILEGKYRETGIDIRPQAPESLAEGVQGALYTQEFGVIVH